jgi:penicillin-binding protein 2
MRSDKARPLFNRAVSGTYPPGSIFKPLLGLAALANDRAAASTTFDCPGYYRLGNVVFRCWRKSGHGSIAMRKAIEQSCNSYFCQLGILCGHERIVHMAKTVGLGAKTGIELPGEAAGLVPDNSWKKRRFNDSWRSGDTCNMSIGQGALLVTPLQMALFAATIANGGHVFRPRLILDLGVDHSEKKKIGSFDGRAGKGGEEIRKMGWSLSDLNIVKAGMLDVIQADSGTGKRARIEGVRMAGKTGTAEYGTRENRKKHTWMILFAPYDNPRYAVSIVIEDGESGGRTAAPLMKELMTGIFDIEKNGASSLSAPLQEIVMSNEL